MLFDLDRKLSPELILHILVPAWVIAGVTTFQPLVFRGTIIRSGANRASCHRRMYPSRRRGAIVLPTTAENFH